MTWTTKKTINFRTTIGFTTDNAGEIMMGGNPGDGSIDTTLATYPVSRTLDGDTFNIGWSVGNGVDGARNRTAADPSASDHRLAGVNFSSGTAVATFKLQMGTASGQYKIWLAIHDNSNGTAAAQDWVIRDSSTTFLTKTNLTALTTTQAYDINGTLYADGPAWAASTDGTGTSLTITTSDTSNGNGGPFLFVDIGTSARSTLLANLAVQFLGGSTILMGQACL